MSSPLTHRQALRYNRQILLPGFDIDRQEALADSSALIVGMGGLGCACSQYLVSSGIGHILIMDADTVDASNLPRQVLFDEQQVGELKVVAARQVLNRLNPDCQIDCLNHAFTEASITTLPDNLDIIIDCTDNLNSRQLLNRLSLERAIPLVSAAAIRMEGQLSSYIPGDSNPCYECVSSLFGELELSCVENGVMAPVVGIMGNMQALEAIKILTGFGQPLCGKLQTYDAMTGEWNQFTLPKRPDCPACGTKKITTS
ncbi:molybdopterin-synthase adenylyltransferase MoeB [Alteromonas aestuariivivens]|uniref:Molybdopterin-synthase adenylyltransferase MoeB n=1 Tax=Alteromonas aestuariivivens TaxID=1938339 RepID=A0A3D8MFH7_9ALTE|nr:molybdopterin-synthase adenylyltransferase MoeB [Alteromonas aestuariivivens]RDV28948.1 molybdopterin-synthase adenylyltransferase MoeB [Alteromonas aestuariivivens]